ncbi:MAG: hypothetical protein ACI9XO_003594 [Paraglaciecola sp.]|jgi:hypothetical protein
MRIVFFLCLVSLSIGACTKKNDSNPSNENQETKSYLHLSHTRTAANPAVVLDIENLDFTDFDMLWLGGDMAQATSMDEETMLYIDSIFDIGSTNTLWALGNHDYPNLDRIQNFTNRPAYYSFHQNGLTFIVLDTQDNYSKITGDQKLLFDSVMDTLENSSHLILLHHKLIWMVDQAELEPQIPAVSNGEFGTCFYCLNANNFQSEIYPRLLEAKQNEIEVICIGGDIGFNTNEFEFTTADSIHFLASGLSSNADENQAILFQHNLETKSLTWEFQRLSDF